MANLKIGITERGDAGIDFTWFDKLENPGLNINGAVVITKKLSEEFNAKLLATEKPVILHCSCTGWGGSWLEPNNPTLEEQLALLKKLIDAGFPANRVVIRIDPIFPTTEGLMRACNVLNYILSNGMPVSRFRISVYDEYNHAKQRIIAAGHEAFYNGSFYAPREMMNRVTVTLSKYPFVFETCAEDLLASNSSQFISTGCVSKTDLDLMGIEMPAGEVAENPQNRKGCHCLSFKTELLENRKRCPNGCLYCYWK